MSGEKILNTAEHDSKGRCIRHPDIRLRKKKLLGGWKILIGHCPECCLEEMRRVRDEIEGGERKKKHKKKHKKKEKRRESVDEGSLNSDVIVNRHGNTVSHNQHTRRHREDGESEATNSTAQMSGGGSVVSEQYYREGGTMSPTLGHGGHGDNFRGHHHYREQQQQPYPPQTGHAAQERTMVLSMPFTDPQTGRRGTYTGQVNSKSQRPDGKGTVYYNDGSIAEGSWSNGMLSEEFSGGSDDGDDNQGNGYADQHHSRNREHHHKNSSHRPHHHSAPQQEAGFGNLHLLDELPGSHRSRPQGASASVQSFNSRTRGDFVSGSASVQAGYPGEGGIYHGGSSQHYPLPPKKGHRGRINSPQPPVLHKRGEYEP